MPKLSLKQTLTAIGAIILSLLPFITSELKFGFQGTKSLVSFFSTQSLFGWNFSNLLINYLNRFGQLFYFNLWGINLFLAGIAGFLTVFWGIKKSLKNRSYIIPTVLVLSPLLLHMFTGTEGTFINLGAGLGAIILTASFITQHLLTQKVFLGIILFLIVFGNLNNIYSINQRGEVLFSVQNEVLLNQELKVIDWIYQNASNHKFRINTITNPLFINTTWAYLFDWYGKSKYDYMPAWWGEAQVNVFGDKINFNTPNENNNQLLYLIIEPGPGIPEEQVKAIKKLENSRSKIVETKTFGTFTVQKREITKPNRIYTSHDVFYEIQKD